MKILLTGGEGFLGWHTRVRLHALTDHDVIVANRKSWSELRLAAKGIGAVIHIAGVNHGSPSEVEFGNLSLARDVGDAVRASGTQPAIIFANSIQAGNDTPYGVAKQASSEHLALVAREVGSAYVDIALPNLFGEHGRPRYNSFVATFVDSLVSKWTPQVADRPVNLMHVQQAANVLVQHIDTATSAHLAPTGTPTTVQEVFETLRRFNDLYSNGDIPPLLSALDLDLFNTLRAARFPSAYPIPLAPRADDRGSLVEVVRVHGGQGHTFVSSTRPGISRGEHFHLRKVERFVVLAGQARISLRKLFSPEIINFDVRGDKPCIIDMPTMWTHNITNSGQSELTTLFWTQELFDPDSPDTYRERVSLASAPGGKS